MKPIFIVVICLTISLGLTDIAGITTKNTEQTPYHNCGVALNQKIANSNGVLKSVDSNGNFMNTCFSPKVIGTPASCTLKASCWNNKKNQVNTSILLSSDLGKLCCY